MRTHLTAASLAGALLSACGFGYTPPEPPSPRDATQVNASTGRTWDAVIDLFAARTIPIRTIERSSGIIVTEQLSVGAEGHEWADCGKQKGWGGTMYYAPNFATYNVLVRGDSAHSSVKATVRWVYSNFRHPLDGNDVTECSTKHGFERAFEAETKARAEASKVAEKPVTELGHSATESTTAPQSNPAPTDSGASTPSRGAEGAAPPRTPQTDAERSKGERSNDQLLSAPDFSRAIRDLQVLRFLDGFHEVGADSLMVEVSDYALTTNLSEYNLGRLFSAYDRITGWSSRATVLFSHRSQPVGSYTGRGLVVVGGR